jgi:hypothetical protein
MIEKNSGKAPEMLPNFNINYVVRKIVHAPFRFGLELRTTHGSLSLKIAANYMSNRTAVSFAKRCARSI